MIRALTAPMLFAELSRTGKHNGQSGNRWEMAQRVLMDKGVHFEAVVVEPTELIRIVGPKSYLQPKELFACWRSAERPA